VEEIGGTTVTIFRQDAEDSAISTIVVRASTHNLLDDIERAIGKKLAFFQLLLLSTNLIYK